MDSWAREIPFGYLVGDHCVFVPRQRTGALVAPFVSLEAGVNALA